MMKRYSILQKEKECIVCGCHYNLHTHEVFYGNNRRKSIKDGCCVYLCGWHHNLSDEGVHFNHKLDLALKKNMQRRWMEYYEKDVDDFIKEYGRNYL